MGLLQEVVAPAAISIIGGLTGSEVLFLALVFSAMFSTVIGTYDLWRARTNVRTRLVGQAAAVAAGSQGASVRYSEDTPFLRFTKSLEDKLLPPNTAMSSRLRLRMVQAGYMNPAAVKIYFISRFLTGIGLPAAFAFVVPLVIRTVSIDSVLLVGAALAGVGVFLPSLWISFRTRRRQREIREGFPDALDLLLVSVEAGLGLDAALGRVGDELKRAHPILAKQMGLTGLEIRAGATRAQALSNFAERVGVDEVRSFATLLIQSDALGASVAQTLRVHSDEMRSKRVLRAEEKAHALPVKLSVPLVLLILPALLIVLLGPAVLTVLRTLLPIFRSGATVLHG